MIRTALLGLFVLLAGGCGAGLAQPADPPPEVRHRSPTLNITGTDGRRYQPLDASGRRAAVLVFVLQDCPICNSYAPQVQRLATEYAGRGVPFYLVQVDATLSDSDAAAHAREYNYRIPVLVDRRHDLVNRLGVRAVPTAVVLGDGGDVKYQGRIDDRYFALGKSRQAPTTDELRQALAAVAEGKPVRVARTKVVGCAVPDLPSH